MSRPSSSVEAALRERRLEALRNVTRKTPIAAVSPAQQRRVPARVTRTCAVLSCDEHKSLPDRCFFKFPDETSLRSVWTEMTGRPNWTPNDYSYICRVHFTQDCVRWAGGEPKLDHGSVPTLKLPVHVMEVEYVDEEILDKESNNKESENEMEETYLEENENHTQAEITDRQQNVKSSTARLELLKLFNEVQSKQKQVVSLTKRVKHDKQMLRLRERNIKLLRDKLKQKETLVQKKMSVGGKEHAEKEELLLMPTRYTNDAKTLALNIYSYSPEAYIYLRNTLRTMMPTIGVLDEWVKEGFKPKRVMTSADCLKIVTEAKENELLCKVSIL